MAFSLKILPQEGYLLTRLTGSLSGYDEVLAYIRNSLAGAEEYGTRHILLDEREAVIDVEYIDIISLLDAMDDPERPRRGYRVAALCLPQHTELHTLFETAAFNRSIVYQVFTDKEEALAWLFPGSLNK